MNRYLTLGTGFLLLAAAFAIAGVNAVSQTNTCLMQEAASGVGQPAPPADPVCRPMSSGYCQSHPPGGTCTTGTSTCTQLTGGACVYSCGVGGTWVSTGVCSSGYCNLQQTACRP